MFVVGGNSYGVFIRKDDDIEDLPDILDNVFQNNDRGFWSAEQPMIFAFGFDDEDKATTTNIALVNVSNISRISIGEKINYVEDKYKKFVTYGDEND